MDNIKTIEFYKNGTIKRIEYFEGQKSQLWTIPLQPQKYQWQPMPYTITCGSTSASDKTITINAAHLVRWFSPYTDLFSEEEDEAWKDL